MKSRMLAGICVCLAVTGAASADLIGQFAGFTSVNEVGVSGLMSDYHADTIANLPISGPTVSSAIHTLGSDRVTYPNGVGQVPSPGGAAGRIFDEGMLGVMVDGGNLIVRVANGLDPLSGYAYDGVLFSQGDAFLTVQDSSGIHHYALLNTWARDEGGTPFSLNGGHADAAGAFHVGGGDGGGSLEGHLVQLSADRHVLIAGGDRSFGPGNAPAGLDIRVYAQGGTDRGAGALAHSWVNDLGQDWYLQTWTIPLSQLSSDSSFGLGVHVATSCANDQIGLSTVVPEPSNALLILLALAVPSIRRR